MLTCKDFLGWLNEYLDQTADPETRQQLEAHVKACPNCWVIYDTTKQTVQIYKGMEAQEIPSAVHDRLVQALQRRMESKVS
ncbi:MAG: zf-HC2 domain-containing protein [Bryobacterales bacterium]|nr:zf-HC2 domain-containing protein [Bryobacterales bacterium]